jgi:hypothetical protein
MDVSLPLAAVWHAISYDYCSGSRKGLESVPAQKETGEFKKFAAHLM